MSQGECGCGQERLLAVRLIQPRAFGGWIQPANRGHFVSFVRPGATQLLIFLSPSSLSTSDKKGEKRKLGSAIYRNLWAPSLFSCLCGGGRDSSVDPIGRGREKENSSGGDSQLMDRPGHGRSPTHQSRIYMHTYICMCMYL